VLTETKKYVYYSEYGAVGDGVVNDFAAIIATHRVANKLGLAVRADKNATYYIGGENQTAVIQTDTDWGNAKFVIDDRTVVNPNSQIFNVVSKLNPIKEISIKTLSKYQKKIDLNLTQDALVIVMDETTYRHKREGINQDDGFAQTDLFLVSEDGYVDLDTPIMWDFEQITDMTIYPIDETTLTIKGGHFTTIANDNAGAELVYYKRGIGVNRSNVIVCGLCHVIENELENGAPYGGFICIKDCANVMIRDVLVSAHKVVKAGSYDLLATCALNLTYQNCKQLNDIHDPNLWGVFGSNYTKNIIFDQVIFSRFDAHKGTTNGMIKDSIIGYMGVLLIGWGDFLIENTKVYSSTFIGLRSDYGSSWEGMITVKNCEFIPRLRRCEINKDPVLIDGYYTGKHDFGYFCYMPRKITIDGLKVHDLDLPEKYQGLRIFADFNREFADSTFVWKYPYAITEELLVKNVEIDSEKMYTVSRNSFMFRNIKITNLN